MNLSQGLTLVHRKDDAIIGNLERYGDAFSVRYSVPGGIEVSTPLVAASEIVKNWRKISFDEASDRIKKEAE